jgi:hypothetical protein
VTIGIVLPPFKGLSLYIKFYNILTVCQDIFGLGLPVLIKMPMGIRYILFPPLAKEEEKGEGVINA